MKDCANCNESLTAGDEVKWECDSDLYFCNTNCAREFYETNPELLEQFDGQVEDIRDILSTRILA